MGSAVNAGTAGTQVSRVAIRMYLSIGPGGALAANFTIDTFTAERTSAGLPTVSATVHNTGGRAIDLSGTLNLTAGPGGLSAGPWTAKVTLQSGLLVISEQATTTFPAPGLAAPVSAIAVPSGSSTPGWLYPVIIGVVPLLLIIIVLLFVVLRSRRKPREPTTVSRT